MGKEESFQQVVLGPLTIHMQKNGSGHLPYTKITSKRTKDLNIRSKTIKLTRKYRLKSLWPQIRQQFLRHDQVQDNNNGKMDKCNFIKSFYA